MEHSQRAGLRQDESREARAVLDSVWTSAKSAGAFSPTHFEQLTARVNSCPDTRLDPAVQTDYETALGVCRR